MRMPDEACQWCGLEHDGLCPRVREIEYYPEGGIRAVRFWDPWGKEKKKVKEDHERIE